MPTTNLKYNWERSLNNLNENNKMALTSHSCFDTSHEYIVGVGCLNFVLRNVFRGYGLPASLEIVVGIFGICSTGVYYWIDRKRLSMVKISFESYRCI
jgi:hypothetical protein